jgi:hypothetical protein
MYAKSQTKNTNYVSVNSLIQPKKSNRTKVFDLSSDPVQKSENKTGLPNYLKAGIENLSGMSMDDVQVHYNSSEPAQLQALAYTQGTDIHVGPGQEKHLPHEAWHVVQQKQGRVQPTFQMKGVGVNDDAGLEREADDMGEKADLRREKVLQFSSHFPPKKNNNQLVQFMLPELPSGLTHKSDVTEEIKSGIAESEKTFSSKIGNLSVQYILLKELGFKLPHTTQLYTVNDIFSKLKSYLYGKFSVTKRQLFITNYNKIRDAESNGLLSLAEREIEDIYPLNYKPEGKTLNKILKGIFIKAVKENKKIKSIFLEKYIDKATEEDRNAVKKNPRLRKQAKDCMEKEEYKLFGNKLNILSVKLDDIFQQAVGNKEPVFFAAISQLIAGSSKDEIDEVRKDEELLDAASRVLAPPDAWIPYPQSVPNGLPELVKALHLNQKGKIEPYNFQRVDEAIQRNFNQWIRKEVTIPENVVILQSSLFKSVQKKYAANLPGSGQVNAFTEEGTIFLNANRGEASTIIHEGIHLFADGIFRKTFGDKLDEGVTEYFARKVAKKEFEIERDKYPEEYKYAAEFIKIFSMDEVARVYFGGGEMNTAIDAKRIKEFKEKSKAGDLENAMRIITERH